MKFSFSVSLIDFIALVEPHPNVCVLLQCDVLKHLKEHDYCRQKRISARRAARTGKPEDCSKCPCCRDVQVRHKNSTFKSFKKGPDQLITYTLLLNSIKKMISKHFYDPWSGILRAVKCKMKWTDCVKELLLRQSCPLWCIWRRFFLSCCWNFLWRSWKFAWADVLLCAADFLQFSAAATKPPQKRKRSSESRPSKPSHSPGERNLLRWSESAIPPADLPEVSHDAPSRQQPSSTAEQLNATAGNQDGPLKIHELTVEEYQHVYREEVDAMLR